VKPVTNPVIFAFLQFQQLFSPDFENSIRTRTQDILDSSACYSHVLKERAVKSSREGQWQANSSVGVMNSGVIKFVYINPIHEVL
jgi:hypothetical protein